MQTHRSSVITSAAGVRKRQDTVHTVVLCPVIIQTEVASITLCLLRTFYTSITTVRRHKVTVVVVKSGLDCCEHGTQIILLLKKKTDASPRHGSWQFLRKKQHLVVWRHLVRVQPTRAGVWVRIPCHGPLDGCGEYFAIAISVVDRSTVCGRGIDQLHVFDRVRWAGYDKADRFVNLQRFHFLVRLVHLIGNKAHCVSRVQIDSGARGVEIRVVVARKTEIVPRGRRDVAVGFHRASAVVATGFIETASKDNSRFRNVWIWWVQFFIATDTWCVCN